MSPLLRREPFRRAQPPSIWLALPLTVSPMGGNKTVQGKMSTECLGSTSRQGVATVTKSGREAKAGGGGEDKGRFQLCPDERLPAWGPEGWPLPLVWGAELAVSSGPDLGGKWVINQVLALWGRLLHGLLFHIRAIAARHGLLSVCPFSPPAQRQQRAHCSSGPRSGSRA